MQKQPKNWPGVQYPLNGVKLWGLMWLYVKVRNEENVDFT